MRDSRITAVLLILAIIASAAASMHPSRAESSSEGRINVEAVIGAHSGSIEVDAKLTGKTGEKLGRDVIGEPAIPEEVGFHNATVFIDSNHIIVKARFSGEARNGKTGNPLTPPGPGVPGVGLLSSKPDNLTLTLKAAESMDPSTNTTKGSFRLSASFDTRVNDTRSHYIVYATGDSRGVNTGFESGSELRVHVEISHTFTLPQHSYTGTGFPGSSGTPGYGLQGNLTAHTYIDAALSIANSGNTSRTNYSIVITTDDSMDWMLYSMIAMMMQYANASVTITPEGSVPITGVQNVTITIKGSGEAPLTSEIQEIKLNPGELEGLQGYSGEVKDASLLLEASMRNNTIVGSIDLEVTGDFSKGVYIPATGVRVKYASFNATSAPGEGGEYSHVWGEAKISYDDPVDWFICMQRNLLSAAESQEGSIHYTLESGSGNVSFILDGKELKRVVITRDNLTLLERLKIKYGYTIAGGLEGRVIIEIKGPRKEVHVNLPQLSNESEVEVLSNSERVVAHVSTPIQGGREFTIKISLSNGRMVVIKAEPGTIISRDINVTVLDRIPGELLSGTPGYKPVGPAYVINTRVGGTVTLGLTVNTENLDGVKVLWIHDATRKILDPVSVDEENHVVYVRVNGFSTFIPVVEAASTTPHQTGSHTAQTSTTSQSTATQPGSTGTVTPGEEGKGVSPAMVLGGVIIVILVALLAVYVSRH